MTTWNYDEKTKTLTISGTGEMEDYDYEDNGAPWAKLNIEKVIIEDGVTSIGDSAFSGCSSLTSVTIPDNVTNIGIDAFSGCSSLTSVTIPDSVTSIGDSAFHGCSGLTSIEIPDSVTNIEDYAFVGCSSLKSVTIKNPQCYINDSLDDYFDGTIYGYENSIAQRYAESYGYNFESLGLITSGYCGAEGNEENVAWNFDKSTGTLTISGKGEMTDWDSEYGDYYAPWFCYDITDVIIENGVTSIGDYAFYECSLTSVMISDSVTSIGGWAFEDCGRLTSVTIPDSVTYIGNYSAFKGTPWLDAQLEDSPFAIAGRMIIDSNPKTCVGDIVIPNGITTINAEAFSHCTGLTSVTIPNSVTSIEVSAFLKCNSLTSVTIPDSVTRIGWSAFADCTSLTSVIIPDSVTSIGGGAFSNTPWLDAQFEISPFVIVNNIVIDSNPETCVGDVVIPDSVTSIAVNAFFGCSSLTSLTIPNSVTSIEYEAFLNCRSLTSVTIPDSVTNIEYSAFGLPFEKHENLTIHGKSGSKAQIFATEHGIKFESI